MANSKFVLGPKLVELSPKLSFNGFEQWRQNILYHLTLNENFRPFLNLRFGKKRVTALIETWGGMSLLLINQTQMAKQLKINVLLLTKC